MNEKIRELAQQAGLVQRKFMFGKYYEDDLTREQKKFAELIVREAIWIAYHSHAVSKNAKFTDHLNAVKEHFGIE